MAELNHLTSQIKKQVEVEYVVPNKLSQPESLTPSASAISTKQWNLLAPPGGISVAGAWGFTKGNPKAVIAVLDTGRLHNDSLSPNVTPGVSFTDDGVFYVSDDTPSCETCSVRIHGTYVGGIIAASGNLAYSEHVYGVAPSIKILPVNVFSKVYDVARCNHYKQSSPCLLTYDKDQINALNWLSGHSHFEGLPQAPHSVVAVNMSLGGDGACEAPMQQAFDRLLNKNISVVVAAGNQDKNVMLRSPTSCEGVIPVAAVGPNGLRTYYSNFGEKVKIAAPGGDRKQGDPGALIYSTIDNRYLHEQGTSAAAPHVAGLLGLLYSVDPTLTPKNILNLIQTTSTAFPVSEDLEKSCQGVKSCGVGIINAAEALKIAKLQAPKLVWDKQINVTVMHKTQAHIKWGLAQWLPAGQTPVIYTVALNGIDLPSCTNLSSTECNLKDLKSNAEHSLVIKASDPRSLYGPEEITSKFSTF